MRHRHSSPLCLAIRLTLSWNVSSVTSSFPFATSMDPLPGKTLIRTLRVELLHALPSLSLHPSFWETGTCHDVTVAVPLPLTLSWDATSCCVPLHIVVGCNIMLSPLCIILRCDLMLPSVRTLFWENDATKCRSPPLHLILGGDYVVYCVHMGVYGAQGACQGGIVCLILQ